MPSLLTLAQAYAWNSKFSDSMRKGGCCFKQRCTHKVDTGYDKAEVNKVAICRAVNIVSLHNVSGAVPV